MTGPGYEVIRESQGGLALPPSAGAKLRYSCYPNVSSLIELEKIQSKFDLAIALTLASWSALSLAVQNSWGGPESSEKRDWFAGAISDLIATTPDADVEYVEEFLLQVMNDEFDVNIDDGSGEETAAKIVGLRKLTSQGDFAKVDEMYLEWQSRKQKTVDKQQEIIQMVTDDYEDEDGTDLDSEDEEVLGDINMEEAPPLVKVSKEKIQPKIDDDGFTEVVNRKRR